MITGKNLINWVNSGKYYNYKGHKIFYRQDGQGEDLLIIHGYPFGSYEWKEIVNELSFYYRITLLDLLGMGFSDKPKAHKYSYEEYCEIVNRLLLHLNINRTHILAHDLGVSVLQELIALDLERRNEFQILSSAFVNGSLFIDAYKPRLMQRMISQTPDFIGSFISNKLSKTTINKTIKSIYGKTKPTDAFLDEQWEILNYNDGKLITHLLGRLVFEKKRYQERWIESMQNTYIKMCYICGPADPNSGRHMAKRYTELIRHPKVHYLSNDVGHWPFLEEKELFLNKYKQFLSTIKIL